MKRWTIAPGKGIETLSLEDVMSPTPAPGEVAVRVKAVSLNYRDLVIAKSFYGKGVKQPRLVPCSDGAGVITAVGKGVSKVKVGDRVAGLFFQKWPGGPPSLEAHQSGLGGELDGMLQEEVCLHEEGVTSFPSRFSYEEAACLPCAALTAWHALFERLPLKPGQTVLAMGSGGVSVFALQLAKAMGARVIATSSSNEKMERLVKIGADAVINYKERPDWEKAVKEATAGRGVDHVVEVGGAGTLERSVACAAVGGHIALIGVLAGQGSLSNPFLLVVKNATVSGIYVGSKEHFARMNAFIEEHAIRSIIDRVFSFAEAPAAYRHLESGSHFGKVVVSLG